MGRLIYSFNVSVDGFVETPDHDLSWSLVDEEMHAIFNAQTAGIAASLYGRRLYELMAGYWPQAAEDPESTGVELEFAKLWVATPKIVFSRTLTSVRPGDRLVAGDVGEVLAAVRREFDGDLEVGGPTLAAQFVERDLVDEYRVMIHPAALGSGTPFWPRGVGPVSLRLVGTQQLASGVIQLRYEPRR